MLRSRQKAVPHLRINTRNTQTASEAERNDPLRDLPDMVPGAVSKEKDTRGISEKREISWGAVPSLSRVILTD